MLKVCQSYHVNVTTPEPLYTYVIKAEVGSSDNGSLMHEQGSVENKPETGESGSSEVCEYMYSIQTVGITTATKFSSFSRVNTEDRHPTIRYS